MCEAADRKASGWQGWPNHPAAERPGSRGAWQDLSHVLTEDVANASVFPRPRFGRVKSMPADPLNVTEMQMVVHTGTHVDAPRHFFTDGPAFDEIPLDRLYGPGVVLSVDAAPFGEIGAEDLERAAPRVEAGDIVALDTGWSRHAGTPLYHEHPCLTPEAARWLVARGVKLLACDFPSPDLAIGRRGAGFDWPVHHTLLGSGVLVAENITGHDDLAGRRADFMFLALNIGGSDGAPARVLARAVA